MDQITRQENNLPLIISAGIFSVILWNIPYAGIIFYPFNLFVTYLHEASHGLMAILTGGKLVNFQMGFDTSGVAYTAGGFRPLIISAGYLGSTFWGAMLLMAAFRKGSEKIVLYSLTAFFLIFTLLFARNSVAFLMGLIFAFSTFFLAK